MERCVTCGYELPPQPMRPGDFVEWICGRTRLAVVLALNPINTLVTVLILTGVRKGDTDTYCPSTLRVVHGYVHIRRVPVDVPCTHQTIQFVDAETPDYHY